MENLSQDSEHLNQDLILGPPEYEAGVQTIQPQCLVWSGE
jgi:hypothetical protein